MTDESIQLVDDSEFKYYKTLLAQYPIKVQKEINFPDDPKDIEVAFAALWDGKPVAWASLKNMTMADGETKKYVLFAPMLIASNYEITSLMESRIRHEAKTRGASEVLHIGLMPQAAESFGFKPTTYEDQKNLLDFCLKCETRYQKYCQPMIMKI